jgi:hypothetical protein
MLLFISIKNLIFILGIILLMRFIGKMMSARRNINEQTKHKQSQADVSIEKEKAKRNFGRTSVEKIDEQSKNDSNFTDFEEVD